MVCVLINCLVGDVSVLVNNDGEINGLSINNLFLKFFYVD